MTYYFNTPEQIKGDKAYNNKHYIGALTHYNDALETLKKLQISNKKDNNISYELAYVYGEVIQTKIVLINTKKYDEKGFKSFLELKKDVRAQLAEANAHVTTFLSGSKKREEEEKLNKLHEDFLENSSIAYWNRISYLTDLIDNEEHDVTPLEIETAINYLNRYIQINGKLIHKDKQTKENDHKTALTILGDLYDQLSDVYSEQGDNEQSLIDERIQSLKNAIKYNQQSLETRKIVKPEKSHILLHLSYLNLYESLFRLNKDQACLKAVSDYLALHQLHDQADSKIKLEIKSYQFLVASESQPPQTAQAQNHAKEIVRLGRFDDRPALAEAYDKAQQFLTRYSAQGASSSSVSFVTQSGFFQERNSPSKRSAETIESDNLIAVNKSKFIRTGSGKKPVLTLKPQLTNYQEKLKCINVTLNKMLLNRKLVSSFLSIAADFHFTKTRSAAMKVCQFELYQQALVLYNYDIIKAQSAKLYNANTKLLAPQMAKIQQEPIVLNYPTDTHEGLLANFRRLFEDHLIQIDVLHENGQEYINEFLDYWARKVSENHLIAEKDATALIANMQGPVSNEAQLMF